MCVLCQTQQGSGFPQFAVPSGNGHLQYGVGSVATASPGNNANTDALISGYKWAGTNLTFAMPSLATAYPAYSAGIDETGSFAAIMGTLATGIRTAMAHISAYTGLTITETTNTTNANLLIGRTGLTATAHAYLPDGYFKGGDVWFGTSADYDSPLRGNYAYTTALHEIGHALGLKHAHTFIGGADIYEDDVGITSTPVTGNRDSLEFTIMTYRSHIGQDLYVYDYYTNEDASFPQTLMMYDIAALQQMYGADFITNATDSVYTFNTATGEMSINGAAEGTLAGNRVFRTVWDGGGTDTYDFSNYSANQTIDLTPGNWSLFSTVQRADLGSGNYARGNVFNALQFGADVRSLIENAIGGSGNDSITGNQANNALRGGAGSDTMLGGAGDDVYEVNDTNDVVTELTNAGIDTVETTLTVYTLGANLENLTGLGNVNKTLTGNAADNIITGGLGADYINGGTGADGMLGGDGNDVYFVDNAADVIIETNAVVATGGYDVVYASVNHTLSANVEQLALSGAALIGTGNAGANVITGLDLTHGVTISSLAGNDVIYGSNYADSLVGGADNDAILAFAAVDGIDTLVGGAGDDVYFTYTTAYTIVEDAGAGTGTDTHYTQTNTVMAANVEQMIIYGGAILGTGNSGDNIIFGTSSGVAQTLDGAGGNDVLYGSGFNDTLIGGTGNDALLGFAGINTLDGGDGSDVFFSASATDIIIEGNGALSGIDTLYATYNVTALAANVEQLILYNGATLGTGNSLANNLYGTSSTNAVTLNGQGGNDYLYGSNFGDTLIGGTGDDVLLGFAGNDKFAYTTAGNMGNDTIVDFNAGLAGGQDLIDLSGLGYTFGVGFSVDASGANTLITFTGGSLNGTTITLTGVTVANVTATDFVL
jgi:serralysin